MKKKIYLAGGWFDKEQEEEHTRIYETIKEAFDVFNPRIEGEIKQQTSSDAMTDILIGNIEGIKNADLVLVIYDRKDTGTIWEAGCAYANKKPILYYAETLGDKPFNLMLAKTGSFAKTTAELVIKLCDENTFKFKDVYSDFKGDIE